MGKLLIHNARTHGHKTVYTEVSLLLAIFIIPSMVYLKSMLAFQTSWHQRIGLSVSDELETRRKDAS
jgi:hypothetical protein